jgi:hypothetical protein
MIRTSSLHEACDELFAGYPLAVEPVNDGGRIIQSMVLMLQDGNDARFYVLSRDGGQGTSYWFRPWPAGSIVDIAGDCRAAISDEVVGAVTSGVPLPRNGSLFGWMDGNAVTALLAVHTEYTPASLAPSWAVMPLVGIPEAQWPPFTGDRFFGHWFWEGLRAERIVLLADLIANRRDTIYWVDTKMILGSACCAVMHDVRSPGGFTLRSGRYVYYKALRAGKPVPPLAVLVADTGKIDLAPLFRCPV